jgi:hypothetical protein
MYLQLVVLGHRATYGREHFARVYASCAATFQLLDDYQLLPFTGLHRKRRATTRMQSYVALLHRMLYVLWVMIVSPNNAELFEPASYEQLPIT